MIFGILLTLFTLLCFILIGLILIQKGKSSMGLGSMGGGAQMLFGGSGGQDVFQKVTWVLGAAFMALSLTLAVIKQPETFVLLQKVEAQQQANQKKESKKNSVENQKHTQDATAKQNDAEDKK